MLNIRLLISILLLFYSINTVANKEYNNIFEQANKEYNNKNYIIADSLYSYIEEKGLYSTELFFNLGNTNYKLHNIPKTIYYYEKALKISPGNEEIIHNLKLANNRIADKNTIKTSSRIEDVIYSYIKKSTNFWTYLSVIFMIICGIILILFFIINNTKVKKLSFYTSIIFLFLGIVTIYLSSLQNNKLNSIDYGIIFSASVELKTSPSDNSNTAFVLHEGTKVKLLNQNQNWYEISFDKGQIAWIKKKHIKTF